jgi:multidrug resistance efflux pump
VEHLTAVVNALSNDESKKTERVRNENLLLEIDPHAARIASHAGRIAQLEAQLEATELETRDVERSRQKSVEEFEFLAKRLSA